MIHPPNSSHAQRAAMKLPTKNRDTDFMEQQTYTEVQTDPNRISKNKGQKQEPWTPRAALADKEDLIPTQTQLLPQTKCSIVYYETKFDCRLPYHCRCDLNQITIKIEYISSSKADWPARKHSLKGRALCCKGGRREFSFPP